MIYFIELVDEELVKIGHTAISFETRWGIHEKRYGNIKFLGWHDGTRRDEAAIHREFRCDNMEDELFRMSPELMEYIEVNTTKSFPDEMIVPRYGMTDRERALLQQIVILESENKKLEKLVKSLREYAKPKKVSDIYIDDEYVEDEYTYK